MRRLHGPIVPRAWSAMRNRGLYVSGLRFKVFLLHCARDVDLMVHVVGYYCARAPRRWHLYEGNADYYQSSYFRFRSETRNYCIHSRYITDLHMHIFSWWRSQWLLNPYLTELMGSPDLMVRGVQFFSTNPSFALPRRLSVGYEAC